MQQKDLHIDWLILIRYIVIFFNSLFKESKFDGLVYDSHQR